jgi:hypothetical protein
VPILIVELLEARPAPADPQWSEADYARRDAVFAMLGVRAFRAKRAMQSGTHSY